jgi:hypothetical protein
METNSQPDEFKHDVAISMLEQNISLAAALYDRLSREAITIQHA